VGQDNKKYEGTGLGLTITKRLVEKMQGTISVSSEIGKGSTFEIILPNVEICNPKSKKIKKIKELTFDSDSIAFEKALILVVDDIESNRNLIKENFIHSEIQIIEAENGKIGVQLAKEFKPDVILMDIKMPVMDGYQAAEQLRMDENTRHIPIIVLTASSTLEEQERIKNANYFNTLLIKPIDVSELFQELSHFLKFTRKIKTEQTQEKAAVNSILSTEQVSKLPELINILESQLLLESREIASMMEMDEVESFAQKVVELGKEYNVTLLTNYGENLAELTENFEIEDIEKVLRKFHKILKRIKALGEKHE